MLHLGFCKFPNLTRNYKCIREFPRKIVATIPTRALQKAHGVRDQHGIAYLSGIYEYESRAEIRSPL